MAEIGKRIREIEIVEEPTPVEREEEQLQEVEQEEVEKEVVEV